MLPGATPAQATALSERIRETVQNTPLKSNEKDISITVSIGVTSESGNKLPPLDDMIARADEALYRAKDEGRNRVVTLAITPVTAAVASA